MSSQVKTQFKSLLTSMTLKNFFTCMYSFMWCQMKSMFVSFVTFFTLNEYFSHMTIFVTLQWINGLTGFPTSLTMKRYFTYMCTFRWTGPILSVYSNAICISFIRLLQQRCVESFVTWVAFTFFAFSNMHNFDVILQRLSTNAPEKQTNHCTTSKFCNISQM